MIETEDLPPKKSRRREATPAQRALALLVRREHSRKELTRKLVARGIANEDAGAAVGRMTESGWQDDARFACSLARTRAMAGYGPLHIRAELATHDIGQQAIQAAFDALADAGEDDWKSRARELAERRFALAATVTLAVQRKAADFLARRGFDGDTIRAVIRGLPED
ncbi:MAG TPA: regulatory protein RecX [Luteimonas sp.]|nr:regulatory protein RecX [Luteimonas sp.]